MNPDLVALLLIAFVLAAACGLALGFAVAHGLGLSKGSDENPVIDTDVSGEPEKTTTIRIQKYMVDRIVDPLDNTDPFESTTPPESDPLAADFAVHARAVREQVSRYADLLADGDAVLRARLRRLEDGTP